MERVYFSNQKKQNPREIGGKVNWSETEVFNKYTLLRREKKQTLFYVTSVVCSLPSNKT